MKKLPIGVQSFAKLIQEGYLYVDKTRWIYELLQEGGQYFFLSRPRRFGKSLLLSTLAELFRGNKDLFEGLWIYDRIDWHPYPVIHIDASVLNYKTPERLEETLERLMDEIAATHGLSLSPARYYNEKFKKLIYLLAQKKGDVVILIDEYDKPIIDKIENPELAAENRDILREFYSIIKTADQYVKFAFITGVSKFSRVSVFSGLNNLYDLTTDSKYSTLLGYTQEELEHYFGAMMNRLEDGGNREELLEKTKTWYNGYSWNGLDFVYNPYSILNLFRKRQFENYWFSTGTPTFLIKLLKSRQRDIGNYEHMRVGGYAIDSFDIDHQETTSLLFQTGYLTIKKREIQEDGEIEYILSYPNREVHDSFIIHLFRSYTEKEIDESGSIIRKLTKQLHSGNYDAFFESLRSLFASIPYNIVIKNREAYFHSIIYMVLKLIGINIEAEIQTNQGRIDAIIKTGKTVVIMEFKMGTADEALSQIRQKKYFEPYVDLGQPVHLIGVGFDKEEGNLRDHKLEILKS